ncbi:MAG TPA: D-alanine--D-alanine ligase [Tepidisphaeraceae bacterium]|jgi:D-alanine-D-alanine ligase
MRITVLCGGPSAERDISFKSGAGVAEALRQAGHDVFVSDISPDNLSGLDHPADVVFPVLHGDFGESGELQTILENRGIVFVGSGSKSSALGMDKIGAKQVWQQSGLPTPAWHVLRGEPFDANDLGLPVVVKAIRSGSSIDVFVCKTADDARRAADELIAKHGECMMEQFIAGSELTVGLLFGHALPPIRIDTDHAFFDYSAKYTHGGATHSFDTRLPAEVVAECCRLAVEASAVLGCRDLARVDLRIMPAGEPFLLEINTMPGFTGTSLLPEAAAREGMTFPTLVDRLVRTAASRAPRAPVAEAVV